jgi:hypothetical protein
MAILIIAALIGLIPASIARNKGYSFGVWWFYGAMLFIVALPHALLMKPNQGGVESKLQGEGMRKCPRCAEMIRTEATKCRYCSSDLQPSFV